MSAEIWRELSDRAFEDIRRTMRPGEPSIPVAACWVTSLLTMPWERFEARGPERAGNEEPRPERFRAVDLEDNRVIALTWQGRLAHRNRHFAQLRIPRECLVRGFSLEVQGAPAPACHVTLILPRRRELFTLGPHRLATVGADGVLLPWPGAIPLKEGEPLVAELEFTDPPPWEGSFSLLLRISYRAEPHFGTLCVRPFTVEFEDEATGVPAAIQKRWDLPPGRTERWREITPAVAGRLMAISATLGPHGTEARLEDLDSGDCLWKTAPLGVARPGWFVTGKRMLPGRRYVVKVAHENPGPAPLLQAAFGEFRGVFLPARKEEWPEL